MGTTSSVPTLKSRSGATARQEHDLGAAVPGLGLTAGGVVGRSHMSTGAAMAFAMTAPLSVAATNVLQFSSLNIYIVSRSLVTPTCGPFLIGVRISFEPDPSLRV